MHSRKHVSDVIIIYCMTYLLMNVNNQKVMSESEVKIHEADNHQVTTSQEVNSHSDTKMAAPQKVFQTCHHNPACTSIH